MKTKQIIKLCIDLTMTAALPVLMCYSIVGETAHEVIGAVMFGMFIAHHILNFVWIRTLFKGRYTLRRVIGTLVDILVFICMLGLIYSGIAISKHIFTFVDFGGTMTARTVHMLCAYWGLILMSVHLGMHMEQMAARVKINGGKLRITLHIIFGFISAISIYEFIKLNFTDHLFGKVQFAFIDMSASAVLTVLQYFSVMVLLAEVGYWITKTLTPKRKPVQS